MIGPTGENLIFIISQPGSGSTMVQRVLGSHPDVHTTSEPWLLLNPFYNRYIPGLQGQHHAKLVRRGTAAFVETLPDGQADYDEGIRRMHAYLYNQSLTPSGKTYFLDKTPPYSLIIADIYRIFPDAKFVLLFRHPLAVLHSLINRFVRHNWHQMHNHRDALLTTPERLLAAKTLIPNVAEVRYEELVASPKEGFKTLCAHLGLAFDESMIVLDKNAERWEMGDHSNVYRHDKPVEQFANKWQQGLDDPQMWRLTNDYLHILGRDKMADLGYNYDDAEEVLAKKRPSGLSLLRTQSLPVMLSGSDVAENSLKGILQRVRRSLRRRGLKTTIEFITLRLRLR